MSNGNGNAFQPTSIRYPNLVYKTNVPLDIEEVTELYRNAGMDAARTEKSERVGQMYKNSNLVVTAWDGDKLVGTARSLTDFCYCCYVSDLAVLKEYQHGGIGKELLRITKEIVGEQTSLFLMAAKPAMEYYPKIGMSKIENGFIVPRTC